MEKLKETLRKLSLHTHSWIATGMMLVGLLLAWIGSESGEGYLWVFVVGCILVILTLFYAFLVFRCPHCDRLLATRTIPSYCPHCGEKLE